MSPRTEEANQRIREEQKQRILAAATTLFAHRGFSDTKMTDIAAAYERDLYFMTAKSTEHKVPMPPATDLYNIDYLLSEEERLVRDTVRKFVNERVLPIIGERFEAGTFPRELIPTIAELGLLGMHLEGYGCAGSSAVSYGLACQELEAGDSGLRSFVSVQSSLAMFPIWSFGS